MVQHGGATAIATATVTAAVVDVCGADGISTAADDAGGADGAAGGDGGCVDCNW